ncbi:hypothetical protein BC936DRAFT_145786 [Jimgerdemannia flammicorona]|uniref:Uncharacterized protein n=1 Tax=Jimgerdemannia flammicorona TaxID=994334 RepID=A0A433D942_9FUNG|nr:hypothetical protein BC936DRAFT_145786 [Jimgerdemannia flammicorona]
MFSNQRHSIDDDVMHEFLDACILKQAGTHKDGGTSHPLNRLSTPIYLTTTTTTQQCPYGYDGGWTDGRMDRVGGDSEGWR